MPWKRHYLLIHGSARCTNRGLCLTRFTTVLRSEPLNEYNSLPWTRSPKWSSCTVIFGSNSESSLQWYKYHFKTCFLNNHGNMAFNSFMTIHVPYFLWIVAQTKPLIFTRHCLIPYILSRAMWSSLTLIFDTWAGFGTNIKILSN